MIFFNVGSASEEDDVCEDESYLSFESEFDDDQSPNLPNPISQNHGTEENDLVKWILIVILRLQAKHYIPEAALNSLIKFLFVFFSVIGRTSPYVAKIVASFPRSLYDLRRRYNLTHNFKKIVVAPNVTQRMIFLNVLKGMVQIKLVENVGTDNKLHILILAIKCCCKQ